MKLAKRLSIIEKEEIIKLFSKGENIEFLVKKFSCSKLTIIRNLKKSLGEVKYKDLLKKRKPRALESIGNLISSSRDSEINQLNETEEMISGEEVFNKNENQEDFYPVSTFIEIAPLDLQIENQPRKELSSIPLADIDLPNVVYMIVDKNIELNIKCLKDYPEWEFLPEQDLKRKAIEIFFDLKIAKRICSKDQKVIKVPNTEVFRIASPFLLSKGITRIVTSDKLLAI